MKKTILVIFIISISSIANATNYKCVVIRPYYSSTHWPPRFAERMGWIADYYYSTGIVWNSTTFPYFTKIGTSVSNGAIRPIWQSTSTSDVYTIWAYDLDSGYWFRGGLLDMHRGMIYLSDSGKDAFLKLNFLPYQSQLPSSCSGVIDRSKNAGPSSGPCPCSP